MGRFGWIEPTYNEEDDYYEGNCRGLRIGILNTRTNDVEVTDLRYEPGCPIDLCPWERVVVKVKK